MTLAKLISDMVDSKIDDKVSPIWIAFPGQVESVNRQNFTCNVYLQMDSDSLYNDLPIMTFSTGEGAIFLPIKVGDVVMVFASTGNVSAYITKRDATSQGLGGIRNFTPEFVIPLGRYSEDDGTTIYKDEIMELPSSLMKMISKNGIYLCAPEVLVSDLVVEDVKLLPSPSSTYRGRMYRIQGDNDLLMVCVNKGGTYTWQRVVMENPPFGQMPCNFTVS